GKPWLRHGSRRSRRHTSAASAGRPRHHPGFHFGSELRKRGRTMPDCNCRQNNPAAGGVCVECDIPQLARNHYFTGKLLVERDFTDEQRYFLGKLRRHNQRLHGWGTVCGLKVLEHPNPACQDRIVRIEPGTAIDCCGREILLLNEEYFDFRQAVLNAWQAQNGPSSEPDDSEHTLQICVNYRECAAEDVPALFDDCSHDGAGCRPNRLVDGYSFDVRIDPASLPSDAPGVKLAWDTTINLDGAERVAYDSANKVLYVLTGGAAGAAVYAVDATNNSILRSQSFSADTPLDLAVSPEGDFVYIALQPSTSGADPTIAVLKSDFTATINTLTVTGGAGKPVFLAVAPVPDDRLLAVNPVAGAFLWATDITTSASPAAHRDHRRRQSIRGRHQRQRQIRLCCQQRRKRRLRYRALRSLGNFDIRGVRLRGSVCACRRKYLGRRHTRRARYRRRHSLFHRHAARSVFSYCSRRSRDRLRKSADRHRHFRRRPVGVCRRAGCRRQGLAAVR